MTRFVIGPDVALRLAQEADALVTLDEQLATAAATLVRVEPYPVLLGDAS